MHECVNFINIITVYYINVLWICIICMYYVDYWTITISNNQKVSWPKLSLVWEVARIYKEKGCEILTSEEKQKEDDI